MKRRFIKILSGALALVMFCMTAVGCSGGKTDDDGEEVLQSDLMEGYVSDVIAERLPDEKYYEAVRKLVSALAVKNLSAKENSALSPLAAMFSVSLIANMLTDKSQNELLHALGDFKMAELNEYNATFSHILKKNTGASVYSSFRITSDKKGFVPDKSFLQLNASYYGADGYLLSFADSDVNALLTEWVQTRIGIKGLTVDAKCTADTVSLLADTLSLTDSFDIGFSGKESAVFNTLSGEKEVSFLISKETQYVSTAKAKGFAKTMTNGYTFVALLPQSTSTLEQLVQSLDAETLKACYNGITERDEFNVKIPEFSFSYCASVTAALKSLGIKALFEKSGSTAETEKYELTVNNALNITSVKLTENGFTTSSVSPAAAEIQTDSVESTVTALFDKPFAFIIYDESGIPLTLGTVVEP